MTSYIRMNKKIRELEARMNSVDYPNELLKNKKWTPKYINQLYEYSVNGARSAKAIAYLKKVNSTVHSLIAGCSAILILLVAIMVVVLCGRK